MPTEPIPEQHAEQHAKRRRRLYFWATAAALIVRFVYFVEHSQSAFFHVPILDEVFYENVAQALVEALGGDADSPVPGSMDADPSAPGGVDGRVDMGDLASINPSFRPLLYPAFLALAYGIGEGSLGDGWGHPLALVMQHLLGVLTTLCIVALALRLFRRIAAGALAAGAWILAGPPLFFEGELLITTLFTFLFTLLLLVSTRISDPVTPGPPSTSPTKPARLLRRMALLAVAGLLLALAAQARANALVLLPSFLVVPWLAPLLRSKPAQPNDEHTDDEHNGDEHSDSSEPARRSWLATLGAASAPSLLGFLGVALATTLGLFVAAHLQEPHFGQFRLLPGAGGVNLYLGNKIGADGMVPRQDQHAAYGNTYRDSVQLFSIHAYREATGDPALEPDSSAVSRYWLERTRQEILAEPLAWLRLVARKTMLLFWHREIPNNKGFEFMAREEVPLLAKLPMGFAPLLALAALGLVAAWRGGRRDVLLWILAFGALHGISVVLFFVNGRFRLPLWPLLAVLAGGGALALWQLLRRALPASGSPSPGPTLGPPLLPGTRDRIIALGLALLAAAVSGIGWPGVEPPSDGRDFFFRSLALYEKGDMDGARRDAERAVELEPSDPAAQFQLGTVALAQDDLATAERHMSKATYLAPEEPRIFNNLGAIYEQREEIESAYTAYLRALQLDPDYVPTLINIALMELRAGALQRAERRIDRAENLGDRSVSLQCARAFYEIHRGRVNLGRALLAAAIHRDEELALRLAKENAQPLLLRIGHRELEPGAPSEDDP